ncbi:MAG TPA: hypothetical protein PKL31_11980 [Fulvivirga sp.]|nr:hypothetical protein [Fulvivirga sp.]
MPALKIVFAYFFILIATTVEGQVEHNFKMGPEKTNCQNIPLEFKPEQLDSAIIIIQSATYRYTEHIVISRYYTPREATFYSCDGDKGWVIARINDTDHEVYSEVPLSIWETFANSEDPIADYKSEGFQRYLVNE